MARSRVAVRPSSPAPRPQAALGHLRRRRIVGASLVSLAATRRAAAAADAPWPDRPVRLVLGMPPGGISDQTARTLAGHLATAFGQPFYVENRTGAGGTIGAAAVAAARDGHTLGFVLGGPTTTARAMNPGLPYDPERDFTPVSLILRTPFVLTLHPSVPARDWGGFVDWARGAAGGGFSYASVGPGTVTHVAMEELKDRLGFAAEHIAYRGFAEATKDLLAGHVQAMFNTPGTVLDLIAAGRLTAVVQTGEARLPILPEVPTFEEAGLPDTAFFGWLGVVAPAGFPRRHAERVAEILRAGLEAEPALRARWEASGAEILATSPAALDALQRREAARWTAVIRRLGLQAGG